MVTIINLPQRFQIVNGLSPVDAGIRMLPLLLVSALGAGIPGVIASKKNLSWHILVLSNALQVLGLGLMSSLPSTEAVPRDQYGFQAILGMGFGPGLSSLVIMTRVEVEDDDLGMSINRFGTHPSIDPYKSTFLVPNACTISRDHGRNHPSSRPRGRHRSCDRSSHPHSLLKYQTWLLSLQTTDRRLTRLDEIYIRLLP